ncbi:MAG: hypothetical protein M1351_08970 [Candidatus Thermoplasmatota archaeon]|nr:hypothetical protein [Candidatus Sysuiplasma jiujiangense]MCL5254199.1 hypothetical protein [Candidatus Thermoplasmatota archaeon]
MTSFINKCIRSTTTQISAQSGLAARFKTVPAGHEKCDFDYLSPSAVIA